MPSLREIRASQHAAASVTTPADTSTRSDTGANKSKGKRAFHRKAKTGCITCKARKVRCDEGKPGCSRCASTGRRCDGYATRSPPQATPSASHRSSHSSSSWDHPSAAPIAKTDNRSSSSSATSDLKLSVLPRKDTHELRSYQYFLDVTGPCLAGSFDVNFWTDEIPRACYADPAIWHAVVSLGAVYETYGNLALSGERQLPPRNVFALGHFNTSIRLLTESSPATGETSIADKWRTLTVCAIFTCICVLEGLFDDARMHFKYGFDLLREIEEDMDRMAMKNLKAINLAQGQKYTRKHKDKLAQTSPVSPISIDSLRCLMGSFEMREVVHYNGDDIQKVTIHSENDIRSVWKTYTVPPAWNGTSSLRQILNKLSQGCRAVESLTSALLTFSQDHSKDIEALHLGGSQAVKDSFESKLKPLVDCFNMIGNAIRIFKHEFNSEAASGKKRRGGAQGKAGRQQIHLLFLCLQLYHLTNRLLLVQLPEASNLIEDDHVEGPRTAESTCRSILDLSEEIVDLQEAIRDAKLGSTSSVPAPPILTPIFMVAMNGLVWADRWRALKLLQRPRLEGFLEHDMSASIVAAMMEREMALDREYRRQSSLENESGNFPSNFMDDDEEKLDGVFNPQSRIVTTKINFTGRREAMMEMWTWHEHNTGQTGWTSWICW